MKRTMKRYLSLLLAIMMLVPASVLSTSAADCSHVTSATSVRIVNSTCTEQGYTENICTLCGEVVSVSNYTKALGHKYGEWTIVKGDEAGTYYVNTQTCGRPYVQKDENGEYVETFCNSTITEMKDGSPVKYYRVSFVNDKATAAYDAEVDYVNLVSEYKVAPVYETYAKENEAPVFAGKNPTRGRTKNFSAYEFIGWAEEPTADPTANANFDINNCINLDTYKTVKNTTLYPVFRGELYKYDVTFYAINNASGHDQLTFAHKVEHGQPARYYAPDGTVYPDPARKMDMNNWYEFAGWTTTESDKLISTEAMLKAPIYDNLSYFGQFKANPLNYTVEFYYDANSLDTPLKLQNGKDAVFNGVHLGDNLAPVAASIIEPIKDKDDTYIYTFTGKWQIIDENGKAGQEIALHSLSVPYNCIRYAVDENGNKIYAVDENGDATYTSTEKTEENREQKKVIRLVPKFERRLVAYTVDVEMILPTTEDIDYYRGGAEISIVDGNGQGKGNGFTDADGKCTFILNNNTPLTVTVATADGKYIGTAVLTSLIVNDKNRVPCPVQMELNPEYETHCSCIHHNALLQPIIVRIYNILYTFFNYKYVCCYDMYSTIGPLLEYAQ